LFAAFFALYAGMLFLVITALLLTPVFHRVLHRFHWEADRAREASARGHGVPAPMAGEK